MGCLNIESNEVDNRPMDVKIGDKVSSCHNVTDCVFANSVCNDMLFSELEGASLGVRRSAAGPEGNTGRGPFIRRIRCERTDAPPHLATCLVNSLFLFSAMGSQDDCGR